MFNIGDHVVNQKTGHIGKVVGYGHQILRSGYETTLKVLLAESENSRRGVVIEDLYSAWSPGQGLKTSIF